MLLRLRASTGFRGSEEASAGPEIVIQGIMSLVWRGMDSLRRRCDFMYAEIDGMVDRIQSGGFG